MLNAKPGQATRGFCAKFRLDNQIEASNELRIVHNLFRMLGVDEDFTTLTFVIEDHLFLKKDVDVSSFYTHALIAQRVLYEASGDTEFEDQPPDRIECADIKYRKIPWGDRPGQCIQYTMKPYLKIKSSPIEEVQRSFEKRHWEHKGSLRRNGTNYPTMSGVVLTFEQIGLYEGVFITFTDSSLERLRYMSSAMEQYEEIPSTPIPRTVFSHFLGTKDLFENTKQD